jgi:hypothetical protein
VSGTLLVAAIACGGGSSASSSPVDTSDSGGAPPVDDGGTKAPDATSDAADGATPPPTGPAKGTVGGHAFTFAHGIAYPRSVGAGTAGYEIFLSDRAIDCASVRLEGAVTVDIDVAGQPPAVRTYAVIDPFKRSAAATEATADFNALDATCGTLVSNTSVSGSVVVTRFDATTVEGSVDITFHGKDSTASGSVVGTFTAPVCTGAFPKPACTPH